MTAEAQPDNDHDGTAEGVDLIEELRRRDPVDTDALPSSHSPEALRTLEEILGSIEDAQPETETPGSQASETETPETETPKTETPKTETPKTETPENSPATDDRGGREAPPPCPT